MTSVHTEGKVTWSESFTCLDNATAVAYQLPGAAFTVKTFVKKQCYYALKAEVEHAQQGFHYGYDHTELGTVTFKLHL